MTFKDIEEKTKQCLADMFEKSSAVIHYEDENVCVMVLPKKGQTGYMARMDTGEKR
jgi:hypothetical protein